MDPLQPEKLKFSQLLNARDSADGTDGPKMHADLSTDGYSGQGVLLEELEQVLKPLEQATVFLSGETYVTLSVLPPLLNGLHQSTKKTT